MKYLINRAFQKDKELDLFLGVYVHCCFEPYLVYRFEQNIILRKHWIVKKVRDRKHKSQLLYLIEVSIKRSFLCNSKSYYYNSQI